MKHGFVDYPQKDLVRVRRAYYLARSLRSKAAVDIWWRSCETLLADYHPDLMEQI